MFPVTNMYVRSLAAFDQWCGQAITALPSQRQAWPTHRDEARSEMLLVRWGSEGPRSDPTLTQALSLRQCVFTIKAFLGAQTHICYT